MVPKIPVNGISCVCVLDVYLIGIAYHELIDLVGDSLTRDCHVVLGGFYVFTVLIYFDVKQIRVLIYIYIYIRK